MYADAGGSYSDQLQPYIPKIGVTPLADDQQFKLLLRDAGRNDPVMRQVQDEFFDKRYFQPAMAWAADNGFTLPLSALVIYDSIIHSGSILGFLRKRFSEKPPAKGGSEKNWIAQDLDARQNWLATADNKVLHGTVYRTKCFKHEMDRENRDLEQLPITANGVEVAG